MYCTVFNHMSKSGGTSVKEHLFKSHRIERQSRPGARLTSDRPLALGEHVRVCVRMGGGGCREGGG